MTPPDRKTLPSRKKSLHHPLAESLRGCRTVSINTQEHDAYHQAFGHQPPCMALRRLLYAAMKNNGYSVMADSAAQLCEVLTPAIWKHVYETDAFTHHQNRGGEKRRSEDALAAYHLYQYLGIERAEISNAIGRLAGMKEGHGMESAMIFFRTMNPLTAMNRMVNEQTGKKGVVRYKWVAPMRESVRREVERLTENLQQVERLTKERRKVMIELLNIQAGRIAKYQISAASSLQENADLLAQLGDRGRVDMSEVD